MRASSSSSSSDSGTTATEKRVARLRACCCYSYHHHHHHHRVLGWFLFATNENSDRTDTLIAKISFFVNVFEREKIRSWSGFASLLAMAPRRRKRIIIIKRKRL